jgi:hypothetical protein
MGINPEGGCSEIHFAIRGFVGENGIFQIAQSAITYATGAIRNRESTKTGAGLLNSVATGFNSMLVAQARDAFFARLAQH